MTIQEVLKKTRLPVAYNHFESKTKPPFIVYLGNSQQTTFADDIVFFAKNLYRIEYYFTKKNETKEAELEELLTKNGFNYEKSDDVYIEAEKIFVIYYYV